MKSNPTSQHQFWRQILDRHLIRRKRVTKGQDEKVSNLQFITSTSSDKVRQAIYSIARCLELPEAYTLPPSEVAAVLTDLNLLEEGSKHNKRVGDYEYRIGGTYVLCTQLSMKKLYNIGRKTKLAKAKMLEIRSIAEDIVNLAVNMDLTNKSAEEAFPHLYDEPINSIY